MQFQQNQSAILLIGNNLNILENVIFALEEAGNKVTTAFDGCEGFLLAQHERPDLIVSQMSLNDVSGVELCRLIRSDEDLCATPFVLIGEPLEDGVDAAEILLAGADDYLSPFHDAKYLAAKVDWLIKRKRSDENLRQYYKILRRRQVHITEIIKETSDLMRSFNDELELTAFDEFCAQETEKLFGKKIELGINMVDSLAHLLEEQVNALEICERTQKGEEFGVLPESCGEKHEYDYYEIIS
ncbi:MAG TPA: response regulator [Pyrinomonadaceae bacterium]|nr:response regulator [Pyrinomonadaceae bacterium]